MWDCQTYILEAEECSTSNMSHQDPVILSLQSLEMLLSNDDVSSLLICLSSTARAKVPPMRDLILLTCHYNVFVKPGSEPGDEYGVDILQYFILGMLVARASMLSLDGHLSMVWGKIQNRRLKICSITVKTIVRKIYLEAYQIVLNYSDPKYDKLLSRAVESMTTALGSRKSQCHMSDVDLY